MRQAADVSVDLTFQESISDIVALQEKVVGPCYHYSSAEGEHSRWAMTRGAPMQSAETLPRLALTAFQMALEDMSKAPRQKQ